MQRLLAYLVFLEAVGRDKFSYLAIIVGGAAVMMMQPFHIILVNQGKVGRIFYDILVASRLDIGERLASFATGLLNVKVALDHGTL